MSHPSRQRGRESLGYAVLILLTLAAGSAAALQRSPSRRNIALGSTVTMSSNCGVEPRGQPGPVRPQGLVDGRRARAYDACTRSESGSWARLDFSSARAVDGLVAYGRGDCCWEHMGFPLVAEVSVDGTNFEAVARRDIPFTREEPWAIGFVARPVKAVRLRSEATKGNLVLSEIEVLEARR